MVCKVIAFVPEYIRNLYPDVNAFNKAIKDGKFVLNPKTNTYEPNTPGMKIEDFVSSIGNEDILNKEVEIDIFGVLGVKGHHEEYMGRIITYVNTRDVARGIGMSHIKQTSGGFIHTRVDKKYYYEEFKWYRFKKYYDRVVENMKKINHPLLPIVKPFDKNQDTLLYIALGICDICTNDYALYFKNAVLTRLMVLTEEENMKRMRNSPLI